MEIGKKMTQLSGIKFGPQMTKILKSDEKRKVLSDNLKNYDRDLEMAKLYVNGATLTDIGGIYGISRERVRQIVGRAASQQDRLVMMYKGIKS